MDVKLRVKFQTRNFEWYRKAYQKQCTTTHLAKDTIRNQCQVLEYDVSSGTPIYQATTTPEKFFKKIQSRYFPVPFTEYKAQIVCKNANTAYTFQPGDTGPVLFLFNYLLTTELHV